jgi:ATP-dependent Lon protease
VAHRVVHSPFAQILETQNLKERMHKTALLLRKEIEIIKIKEEISKKVTDSFDSRQRKYGR